MDRAALLAHKDMAHAVLLENGVVDGEYSAARVPEYNVYALVSQSFDDDFRPGHLLPCHLPVPRSQKSRPGPVSAGRQHQKPRGLLPTHDERGNLAPRFVRVNRFKRIFGKFFDKKL
jgi:hypothetical protein